MGQNMANKLLRLSNQKSIRYAIWDLIPRLQVWLTSG